MFGSIFIGLSGMNAFSSGLRQISNNITNINTTGFKSSGVGFTDLFGAGQFNGGGQGHGVALSDGRLDFAQGELRQTDRDLDLAIDGGGFLVLLKDADKFFTRTGSFEVDPDGFVVLAGTDYRLSVLDSSGNPSHVSVNPYRSNPPEKTTSVKFANNLSSTATSFNLPAIKVFDGLGKSDNWSTKFERTTSSPAGEWTVIVTNGSGAEIGRKTLKFINGVIDPATAKLTFEDTAQNRSVEYDFSANVTSFSSGEVSTLSTSKVDGFGIGEITSIRVNDKGILEIAYSNEQTKSLGAVTVANIRDPNALEQRNAGLFVHNGLDGVDYVTSEHETVGMVQSKRLEASNVDLSKEFGELILVQRGFQASSQVVSVSNEMIQQLFGIRGQG
jgi:flagellar hook protein FlgE